MAKANGTTQKRSMSSRRAAQVMGAPSYFELSQRPWQSLVFLSPLVIAYEAGTLAYMTDWRTGAQTVNSARMMLTQALHWFGAGGYLLPGLLLVVILLAWHMMRRDSWRVHLWIYPYMAIEAVLLVLPQLMLSLVTLGRPARAVRPLSQEMVLSVGAGVYEELVFRLIAIATFHMVFVDLMKMPEKRGAWMSILGSAALFAAFHFWGPSAPALSMRQFAYYFIAGLYLAWVYVVRGFGMVVAVHVAFDLIIDVMKESA